MAESSTKIGTNGKTTPEFPLLATKFYIPPPRPGLIPRPRLTRRLNQGLSRKLTLIAAPAGYGKTTLLSEWRTTSPANETPFAWVSLDEGDNAPARFWAYIITALQTIHAGIGDEALTAFQSADRSPTESILSLLINDLAAFSQDFCLVLDDYHVITAKAIHDGLTFLLQHMPPRMRLIIASRSEPPLPLSLLRAACSPGFGPVEMRGFGAHYVRP